MNIFSSKIQKLSQNQPTYNAYPTRKKEVRSSQNAINTDTVERSKRFNIDKSSNSSF